MVIGENFVWAHLAKAGGNSTLTMFQIIERLIEYFDPIDSHKKHLSFKQRIEMGDNLNGKDRKLNIRRLPSWILSYVNFQKTTYGVPINNKLYKGIVNTIDPKSVNSQNPEIHESHVDETLIYYEYSKVNHWLRVENLADDFIQTVSIFTEVSENDISKIHGVRENVNPNYNKSLEDNFTLEELGRLYKNSPIWCRLEKNIWKPN